MSSLPLFALPMLAQLEVVQNMKIPDLIKLSFLSETMNNLAQEANVSVNKVRFFTSNRNGDSLCVYLTGRDKTYLCNICPFSKLKAFQSLSYTRLNDNGLHWVGGAEWVFDCLFAYPDGRDFYELSYTVIGHILRLFRLEFTGVNVSIHPRVFLQNWGLRHHIEKVDAFYIADSQTMRLPLTASEVDFLMENSEKQLIIEEHTEQGVRYSKGLKVEQVILHNAYFLEFEAILNSKSKLMTLSRCPMPTIPQLQLLLQTWMTKQGLEELQEINITSNFFHPAILVEEVLEDMDHEPFASNDQNWPDKQVWLNNARDIRRIDGKKASVLLIGIRFEFHVHTSEN